MARKYAAGEFNELSRLFEALVGKFATELRPDMADAFRNDFEKAVAEQWLQSAKGTLEGLIGTAVTSAETETEERRLLEQLRVEIAAANGRLDAAALQQEVDSASDVLSQVVVGRWLDRLAREARERAESPLNESMLPGLVALQDLCKSVDFGVYGVDDGIVMGAFRRFKDSLEAHFYEAAAPAPIALATRLFIVPLRTGAEYPYLLVSDPARAAELARAEHERRQKADTDALMAELRQRYRGILQEVRGWLIPNPATKVRDDLLGAVLLIYQNPDGTWKHFSNSKVDPVRMADLRFMNMVEEGADRYGSWVGLDAAERKRRIGEQRTKILENLHDYCVDAGVSRQVGVDLYSHAVAARIMPPLKFEKHVRADYNMQVVLDTTFSVSGEKSKKLAYDAFGNLASHYLHL
ncbi:MAG TPA: hypothetical protein VHP37_19830 [Burkholderiales bacterium]|nr:hypothetical protein [Burkholderiales bacterium]